MLREAIFSETFKAKYIFIDHREAETNREEDTRRLEGKGTKRAYYSEPLAPHPSSLYCRNA